jgi:hypothetical protein
MDRAKAFTTDPASAAAGQRAGVLEGKIHYVEGDVTPSAIGVSNLTSRRVCRVK